MATYDGNVGRFYRNGVEIASPVCGRLRDWDAADPLVLGSEISYHRGWAR